MNITLLECFFSLSETLSFTKTARDLGLTQPSVSRQLKQLEEELGLRLIYRDRHRVELTAEGREFRASLSPLISEMQKVILQTKGKLKTAQGTLGFCCYPEIGQYFFMKILLSFQKAHPQIALKINFCLNPEMIAAVKSGDADFAVTSQPVIAENIRSYSLLEERSVAVTRSSNKNPWPESSEALRQCEFVGYNRRDTLLFQFLKTTFAATDYSRAHAFHTVNSHRAMVDLLLSRDCYAVVPFFSVEEALRQKKLRLAHEKELRLTFYLVHADTAHLSKKNQLFKSFFTEACRKQAVT